MFDSLAHRVFKRVDIVNHFPLKERMKALVSHKAHTVETTTAKHYWQEAIKQVYYSLCVCIEWVCECVSDTTKLASTHQTNVQVKLAAVIWVMPTLWEAGSRTIGLSNKSHLTTSQRRSIMVSVQIKALTQVWLCGTWQLEPCLSGHIKVF